MIHTVLGSCIAVCLWDSIHKFGGMCHYIYCKPFGNECNGKYGEVAIPYLIKLMTDYGSKATQMKAHIVGGGENPHFKSSVGSDNADLAEIILAGYNIEAVTREVKGNFGRKVIFNSGTGEILIYKIHEIRKDDWHGNFQTPN